MRVDTTLASSPMFTIFCFLMFSGKKGSKIRELQQDTRTRIIVSFCILISFVSLLIVLSFCKCLSFQNQAPYQSYDKRFRCTNLKQSHIVNISK